MSQGLAAWVAMHANLADSGNQDHAQVFSCENGAQSRRDSRIAHS